MKKLTLVLAFCAAPALAQITVTPGEPSAPATAQSAQPARPEAEKPPVRRAVPVKSATPAPTATPAPKQKSGGFFGFFRRLFSGGETQKSAVKSTATPKAKPTIAPKTTPAPKTSASATPKATSPQPTATPKVTPAQPKPTATPSVAVTPAPTATPKPVKSPSRKSIAPAPITEGVTDRPIPATANHEDANYQKIKQQALKDPNVTALHEKMISTLNAHPEGGAAYKAAAAEYTSALFEKMRKLDPANAEQINRKENATKRRIDAGLPIVQ